MNLPPCWSAEKWAEKQAQYLWLMLKKDVGLLCQVCSAAKRVTPLASKTSRIRLEWTSSGVFWYGDTKTKQLTSLRKKKLLTTITVKHIEMLYLQTKKARNIFCRQCLPLQVDSMKKQLKMFLDVPTISQN